MNPLAAAICLVSPGHVASNPRLVKEADALSAAGFRVRVVAGDYMPAIRPLDDCVLAAATWEIQKVGPGSNWARRCRALRRQVCRCLVGCGFPPSTRLALWSESDMVERLGVAAASQPADVFIGHYLPGLAAAAHAARLHGAKLGFDAEDSHVDELPEGKTFARQRASRALVESTLLRCCEHVTAASPGIAHALRHRYGVQPQVLLNVFPLREGPAAPRATAFQKGCGPPTLYWFSQMVGPGRGLESIVLALGRLSRPIHLHLRGLIAQGYREVLERLACQAGIRDRIHWHGPAAPDQMAALAAEYDLGLALELNNPPNRAICLTNKIFTYLLAGVPMLLSRTPAQEQLAPELEPAAFLAGLDSPDAVAELLEAFFAYPARQRLAREAAWRLSRERYNWDIEQRQLLASVRRVLGKRTVEDPAHC